MDTQYNTRIDIELEPVGTPEVKIIIADKIVDHSLIDGPVVKNFSFNQKSGPFTICVEMLNKHDYDHDTAIIIKSFTFNDITDPKFVWQGCYYPRYPQHLIGQNEKLPGHNYISWNGVYQLTCTAPIFTWMHQVLDFGWIFD
jgi:hypothetical protein